MPFKFRNLKKHQIGGTPDKMILSFERPQSETGKVRERCPVEDCQPAMFLLGAYPENLTVSETYSSIIRRQPRTQGVTCPYCGHDGLDDDFVPGEDMEHIRKLAMHAAQKDTSDFLGDMARNFNRGQSKNDFFSIRMDHKPSHQPKPFAFREDLLRNISCHVCQREYGVFALALFCPDCGAPNVSNHFSREIDIINRLSDISRQASESGDEELAYRLLANAHEDVLTALEATLKSVYCYLTKKRLPDEAELLIEKIGTAFQSLEKAKKKYRKLDVELLKDMDVESIQEITRHIQKRHVISHNLGLADEKYITVDGSADVGQNVPIIAQDIEDFSHLCARLISSLEKELNS